MFRMRTTLVTTAVVAGALVTPVLAAAPASARAAQGGRAGVEATGACTGAGTWTLKAKPDDGRIEVEFEVDTNVAGQAFTVRITDGSTVVFSGNRATAGRSGSFTVERLTADRAGTDTVRAVASRAGSTCSGVVRL